MNTKKNKNKVKNKPPTTQHKTETSDAEKCEGIPVEDKPISFKPEERVPEIVSDVVPSAVDSQVPEDDSPKKPKRNRNKKKKSETESGSENTQEQKTEVPTTQEIKVTSSTLEAKNVQEQEAARAVTPEVTPAARKKNKNKNKNPDQPAEKPQQEEIKITPLQKGEELTDLKIITIVPVETEESKSKKKNKKKKRTDSERSERADEVLACTAAFQKLLEGRDDKKEEDKKDKKQNKQDTQSKEEAKTASTQEQKEHPKETEKVPEQKTIENKDSVQEEGGKGKKKNKKDKRHPGKGDNDDEMKSVETKAAVEMISPIPASAGVKEIETKDISTEHVVKIESQIEHSIEEAKMAIEKERSPKPKAKIVKPVDKKQKGKGDASSTENLAENVTKTQDKADVAEQSQKVAVELKEDTKPGEPVTKSQKPETKTELTSTETSNIAKTSKLEIIVVEGKSKPPELKETLSPEIKPEVEEKIPTSEEEFGFIPVPESKNKRRKKSPKPKQSETTESHISVEPVPIKNEPVQSKEILTISKEDVISKGETSKAKPEKSENTQLVEASEENRAAKMEQEKEPSKDTEAIPLNIEILSAVGATRTMTLKTPDASKIPELLKERTPEKQLEKESIHPPERRSSKKRKKSPRPKKMDFTPEPLQQSTDVTKDMPREEKEKSSPSMPSLEDIEIKSVKTDESEGSASDIVPYVQYPRASSQLHDDNNNTVIREIHTSDSKLNVPIALPDTPFVQDAGETPSVTPEIMSTSIKITEVETVQSSHIKPATSKSPKQIATPKLEEKTDLKSKVLDVNLGMEELRKSIEKSLAELNAMEKSEKNAEEQFAQAQAKLEAISDLAVKKSEDKKQHQMKDKSKEKMQEVDAHKPKEKSPMPSRSIRESQKPEEKSPMPPLSIKESQKPKEKSPMPVQSTKESQISKEKSPMPAQPVKESQKPKEKSPMPVQLTKESQTAKEKSPMPVQSIKESQKPKEKSPMPAQSIKEHQTLKEKSPMPAQLIQESQKPKEKSPLPVQLTKESQISKEKSPMPEQFIKESQKPKDKSPMPAQSIKESQKLKEKSPMPPQPIKEQQKAKEKSPMPSPSIQESLKMEESKKTKEKSPLPTKKTEIPISQAEEVKQLLMIEGVKTQEQKQQEAPVPTESTTPQPPRRENKGKGKKNKGKQQVEQTTSTPTTGATHSATTASSGAHQSKEGTKTEEKKEQKTESSSSQEKGKQQSATVDADTATNETQDSSLTSSLEFVHVESFEDALFSSNEGNEEDVNKSFEMIANEVFKSDSANNPEINITAPTDDEEKSDNKDTKDGEKVNPVSQPKNLLGHPDIPARLNKTDYKKEKNKTPNARQAKVRIKDDVKDPIEVTKQSKESQTANKRRFLKDKTVTESVSSIINDNEEYVYKYSFRKVFLPSACHVCKKDLKPTRVPCSFCNLVFYCSAKHKDEDYTQHQGLCFAISTIIHLKDQKHIYADVKNITGHEYRLLRMQMIVSCEKVLKRRLSPWEQEALLYPRICADVGCREWRQNLLVDCEGCGQVAYCAKDPSHLPSTHQRWCKSYSLYHKLVVYQQTKGRLEPRLPTRVLTDTFTIPEKLNEVLAAMYEEKIDMTDIQYAALTQIATAPLTAAYCHQLYTSKMNAVYSNGVHKKTSFTIHIVGAELQFEADALNKWEVFFLHLNPAIKELKVVLIGTELNPSKLPLDLLGKIKMCENCRQNKRRVVFDFQDKKTYYDYWSTEFITPDLVCAFNAGINRSSVFNGGDTWPATVRCILKLRVPFVVTAHTLTELQRDLLRVQETNNKLNKDKQVLKKDKDEELVIISEPKCNAFSSVRPDRNFISDDEMPLLFNNYCFAVISGAF